MSKELKEKIVTLYKSLNNLLGNVLYILLLTNVGLRYYFYDEEPSNMVVLCLILIAISLESKKERKDDDTK